MGLVDVLKMLMSFGLGRPSSNEESVLGPGANLPLLLHAMPACLSSAIYSRWGVKSAQQLQVGKAILLVIGFEKRCNWDKLKNSRDRVNNISYLITTP
jgi:hypothetical protein